MDDFFYNQVDELREMVERKMNESADRELERCGSDAEIADHFYQSDNNYDVFWKGLYQYLCNLNQYLRVSVFYLHCITVSAYVSFQAMASIRIMIYK